MYITINDDTQATLHQNYNGWGVLVNYKHNLYQVCYSRVQAWYYLMQIK